MHPDILRQLAAEHTRDLITEAGQARRAREARHPPGRLTGVYKDVRRGVFRAQVVGGQPTPTEESAAVEWRSADRIVSEMAATFSVRVLDADNVPAVVVDADEASLRGSN